MSRTFHRRAPKTPDGPSPSVVAPLREVALLLIELGQKTEANEAVLQTKLKNAFGSVQKSYGSIIALRNALRSAKQDIGG